MTKLELSYSQVFETALDAVENISVSETETQGEDGTILRTSFVTHVVHDAAKTQDMIRQMMEALELCLACNLNWEAETEADIALRRARELVG